MGKARGVNRDVNNEFLSIGYPKPGWNLKTKTRIFSFQISRVYFGRVLIYKLPVQVLPYRVSDTLWVLKKKLIEKDVFILTFTQIFKGLNY